MQSAASVVDGLAAVAQLDRVLGYEPRGRGFDSCQPHQIQASEMHISEAFVFLGVSGVDVGMKRFFHRFEN